MEFLKGYITVPKSISDERVWGQKDKFISQYADHYDTNGWKLFSDISFKKQDPPLIKDVQAEENRWLITAFWDRKPITRIIDASDKVIHKLLQTGKFSLN